MVGLVQISLYKKTCWKLPEWKCKAIATAGEDKHYLGVTNDTLHGTPEQEKDIM